MRRYLPAAMWAALVLASAAQAQSRALIDPQKAMEISAATGKPVLAIAGSTGCIYCKQMAGQLATDPEVQQVGSQFVVLLIDTGTPVWDAWQTRYPVDGGGIPKVFVVRADGEQVYGGTGKPRDLKGFLERQLEGAGTVLDPGKLAVMDKALREAQAAVKRRETSAAVAAIAEHADSGSYAATAVALDALADEFTAEGSEAVNEAFTLLLDESPEKAFEGALKLVEARRIYGALADVKQTIDGTLAAGGTDEDMQTRIAQAELIDQARQHQAERKWKAALATLEKVVSEHPDTPAARLADHEIAVVQERLRDPETPMTAAATPERDERKAASYLQLGKQLADKGSEKARGYLEQAIQLAPDSDIAREAQELLDSL